MRISQNQLTVYEFCEEDFCEVVCCVYQSCVGAGVRVAPCFIVDINAIANFMVNDYLN